MKSSVSRKLWNSAWIHLHSRMNNIVEKGSEFARETFPLHCMRARPGVPKRYIQQHPDYRTTQDRQKIQRCLSMLHPIHLETSCWTFLVLSRASFFRWKLHLHFESPESAARSSETPKKLHPKRTKRSSEKTGWSGDLQKLLWLVLRHCCRSSAKGVCGFV